MRKFLQKNKSGQVTLLALLLGVLGLTIGLSVASRSLSDLKQASYVDFGTKALAAAEAGAEFGLYSLKSSQPAACENGNAKTGTASTDWDNLGIQSIMVDICPDLTGYYSADVAKDEVLQATFKSANANANSGFYVRWNSSAPAVEITAIYSDYSIKRFAYNSGSQPAPWNSDNFENRPGGTSDLSKCLSPMDFESGKIDPANSGSFIKLIRVKPLGGATTIAICGQPNGIEPQQYFVTSTATTKNNLVKKIMVTAEAYGTLPAVFDNVIFSAGDLSQN